MKVVLILIVLTGFASASGTLRGESGGVGYALPATDAVFDSYAYNADDVFTSIPASHGDYAVVDDFGYTGVYIRSYTCWAVTTAVPPTELELLVVPDDSGPDGAPILQTSYPCIAWDSGFTFYNYTVWRTNLDMSMDPLTTYDTVWLGTHRNDGSTWYPLCGTTVSGIEGHRTTSSGWGWAPLSSSLQTGDLFKIVRDQFVALERTTWAGIKSGF
ncbi:MAG: hypothetical protein KAH54_06620 [Candidatus Sabulitectum sp.]|nr:hypothetical protein [Candidatus Sabulitectum sp.]